MKRILLALAACLAVVLATAGAAQAKADGDGPPGFWWGTDSLPVTVPGSARAKASGCLVASETASRGRRARPAGQRYCSASC